MLRKLIDLHYYYLFAPLVMARLQDSAKHHATTTTTTTRIPGSVQGNK